MEGEWFLAILKFRLFKALPLVGNSLIMAWSPFKAAELLLVTLSSFVFWRLLEGHSIGTPA